MIDLPPAAREVLESAVPATLVTVNPDGSPQLSVVWVGLDGHDIVTAHLGEYQKVRNVRRDPRVVVSVLTDRKNPIGMDEYLVVHGTARISEGGAPEMLQRLAETYIGPGVPFPPMEHPPNGFVMRITPQRLGGIGPWAE